VRVLKESGGDLINASMYFITLPLVYAYHPPQSWRRVNDFFVFASVLPFVSHYIRGTKTIPLRDTLQPFQCSFISPMTHQSNVDSPNI
jgi:hypothetical protein